MRKEACWYERSPDLSEISGHLLVFHVRFRFYRKEGGLPAARGLLTVAPLLPEEWPKRLVDVNVGSLADKDLLWAEMDPNPQAQTDISGNNAVNIRLSLP
jgi:hypothetical protein